ncbi:MAG: hypothetical protein PF904_16755 [Kiritimatiellae bacterium]|jgi:hypothetical protein|nr:hypothetical protein [Kiritimatiellia bacterium]
MCNSDFLNKIEVVGWATWWRFYAELGYRLMSGEFPTCKVALVVPSRSYVTAFMAFGGALSLRSKPISAKSYFEYFQSLKDQSALYYQEPGIVKPRKAALEKREKGDLWAITLRRDKKKANCIGYCSGRRIQIREGNCLQFTRANVDRWDGEIINKKKSIKGVKFLKLFFVNEEDFKQFVRPMSALIKCLGVKDKIENEIKDEIFYIGDTKGRIFDFLLCNTPMSKTQVVSQRFKKNKEAKDPITPSVVLYDNAAAYLDHRSNELNGSINEVVIFDRTDPNLQDGFMCWNKEYKTVKSGLLDGLKAPGGVEVAISRGV